VLNAVSKTTFRDTFIIGDRTDFEHRARNFRVASGSDFFEKHAEAPRKNILSPTMSSFHIARALSKSTAPNTLAKPDLAALSKRIRQESLASARRGNIELALQKAQDIPLANMRAHTLIRIADCVQANDAQKKYLSPILEAAVMAAGDIWDLQTRDVTLQSIAMAASDQDLSELALRVAGNIASPRIHGMALAHIAEGIAASGRQSDAMKLTMNIPDLFARSMALLRITSMLPNDQAGLKSRITGQALRTAATIEDATDRDEMYALISADMAEQRHYAQALNLVAKISSGKRRVQAYLVQLLQASEEHGDRRISFIIVGRAAAAAATIVEPEMRTNALNDVLLAREAIKHSNAPSDNP
jgi:hypothetical protein